VSEAELLALPLDLIKKQIDALGDEIGWAAEMGDGHRARTLAVVSDRLKHLLAWRTWKKRKPSPDEKNNSRDRESAEFARHLRQAGHSCWQGGRIAA
jgi:hypothetical protein